MHNIKEYVNYFNTISSRYLCKMPKTNKHLNEFLSSSSVTTLTLEWYIVERHRED